MALRFCSLASGSSGNSYLLASDDTSILIDAGISGKNILEGLSAMGIEHSELSAILVTHEHVDHIKSLPTVYRKTGFTKIYTGEGTAKFIMDKDILGEEVFEYVKPEDGAFMIGDIKVTPFNLSHDAEEPLGFTLENDGKRVSLVTDTGIITEEIFREIVDSDYIVMEANHEVNMMYVSSYPYPLIKRILGVKGHISNDDAADCMVRILRERKNPNPPTLAMAHLSNSNNTPDIVRITINNVLFENMFMEGRDYYFDILSRDTPGKIHEI